jgi:DNA-binding transcriptional LysR family regulator
MSPHPNPHILAAPIWLDRLCYCSAIDHPLACSTALTLNDLTDHAAILPTRTTFTRQLVEDEFQRQQLTLNTGISTNNLDTIRMMVSIGLGWGLLPHTLIDASLATLALQTTPIRRPLGLIYHRDRTLSNAAQAFIHLLEQHAD